MRAKIVVTIGIIAIVLITVMATAFSDTIITKYEPVTDEERRINSLLIRFMEARNNVDVEGFLSTFHRDAEYMVNPDLMASRDELREMLPNLWLQGCDGCITWECINEHCYKKAVLMNPEYSIDRNRGEVKIIVKAGFYRGDLFIDLVKQDNQWQIIRLTRPLN